MGLTDKVGSEVTTSTVNIIDWPTINVSTPMAFERTELITGLFASIATATSVPSFVLLILPAGSVAFTPVNCKGIVLS